MAAMSTPPTYDEGGPTYDGVQVHHMTDRVRISETKYRSFYKTLEIPLRVNT